MKNLNYSTVSMSMLPNLISIRSVLVLFLFLIGQMPEMSVLLISR